MAARLIGTLIKLVLINLMFRIRVCCKGYIKCVDLIKPQDGNAYLGCKQLD